LPFADSPLNLVALVAQCRDGFDFGYAPNMRKPGLDRYNCLRAFATYGTNKNAALQGRRF